MTRRELRARFEAELDDAKMAIAVATELDRLDNQRCVIHPVLGRELGLV